MSLASTKYTRALNMTFLIFSRKSWWRFLCFNIFERKKSLKNLKIKLTTTSATLFGLWLKDTGRSGSKEKRLTWLIQFPKALSWASLAMNFWNSCTPAIFAVSSSINAYYSNKISWKIFLENFEKLTLFYFDVLHCNGAQLSAQL